jgi:cation diffusion facilitator family transporter
VQTFVLLGLAMYIAVQAVTRLQTGSSNVQATWYAFAVVLGAMAIDGTRSWFLNKIGTEERSPALLADALNFRADLVASAGVLIGLVLVRAGYPAVDALASLAIAGYVAWMSIKLGRASIDTLMDRAPEGSMERIAEATSQVKGVDEVRRVRVRTVGGEPQADVTIGISRRVPLEVAHQLTEEVEHVIHQLEPGADVVVHVEPVADETAVIQHVQAVALRQPVVAETHNIFVTSHPEGHHISLHAQFPGSMPLEEAHAFAERLEQEVMHEIPGVARVDTHLEPLGERSLGVDVTEERSALVDWTVAFANRQPEVTDCHEVVVSETDEGLALVVHCDAAPGLSVQTVHEASNRIEAATHIQWPEVRRVTVHFEPKS